MGCSRCPEAMGGHGHARSKAAWSIQLPTRSPERKKDTKKSKQMNLIDSWAYWDGAEWGRVRWFLVDLSFVLFIVVQVYLFLQGVWMYLAVMLILRPSHATNCSKPG